MNDPRRRLLLVFTHPVQYTSPFLREMVKMSMFEIVAAYCSLQGAEPGYDHGFGVDVVWDVPLLEGYPWITVDNVARRPGLNRFWGLINPGLWALVRGGKYDAVLAYTGYANASFWILAIAAKVNGVPLLFGTDATSLKPRDGKRWKSLIKTYLLPLIFRLADAVVIPSDAGRQFMRSLGVPAADIFLTPFAVDNFWWKQRAAAVDRKATRQHWRVPNDASVLLFCAKLQPWKRPSDVLRAYARLRTTDTYIVFAGDGPLRADLEAQAKLLGISDRVRFLGFVNQTGLPSVYRSSDLLVLTSEYDPCPVVVCESMLCSCPVAMSSEILGRLDLVKHNVTGYIFPCGDIEALSNTISEALRDPLKLSHLGKAASARMDTWTPRDNVKGVADALEAVFARRNRNRA
jgi:glycosyltransferase involved in cell wall biosynthesis